MMLYTQLLVDKYFLQKKYKGWKLKKEITRYKSKLESIIYKAIEDKDFIIKFDELYELYILIKDYNYEDSNICIIENTNSNILSFALEIKDIIHIRIDLDPIKKDFRIRCKEIQIYYSIDYVFHINVKYNDYNEDSKEKDKQLMQYINNLLYSAYLRFLNIALDSDSPLKHGIEIGCEEIDEPYIDTEEFDKY